MSKKDSGLKAEPVPSVSCSDSESVLSPKRVQRKRSKGWKMPPNTVYVGRPTIFGNPFRVGNYVRFNFGAFSYLMCREKKHAGPGYRHLATAQECVDAFREYLAGSECKQRSAQILRGKDLACWCPIDQPCHADVLLEIANT